MIAIIQHILISSFVLFLMLSGANVLHGSRASRRRNRANADKQNSIKNIYAIQDPNIDILRTDDFRIIHIPAHVQLCPMMNEFRNTDDFRESMEIYKNKYYSTGNRLFNKYGTYNQDQLDQMSEFFLKHIYTKKNFPITHRNEGIVLNITNSEAIYYWKLHCDGPDAMDRFIYAMVFGSTILIGLFATRSYAFEL